jgi:Fe-S cluster biogenesis protein NfuA
MPWDDRQAREHVQRLEALLDELESFEGMAVPARRTAIETVQALIDLYGEVLARTMALVRRSSDPGLAEALAADELVSHLLLTHDLHPVDVETRVARAVESVRRSLRADGADVELVGVEAGVARLRLRLDGLDGGGNGCGGRSALQTAVTDAVRYAAPELDAVEVAVAGAIAGASFSGLELIPAESLLRRPGRERDTQAIELSMAGEALRP